MRISRQQARQLQLQLGCSTHANFRAVWRTLSADEQTARVARADAAL